MRWFVFITLLIQFEVFSMEAVYEEQLSFRMKVIKMLCDSSQEPDLCPLWQRMSEARQAHDTALEEWNEIKERLEYVDSARWNIYIGSLCKEGLEDDLESVENDPESVEDDPESVENDPESVEDDLESVENDPFVYFCNQRVQLIKARKILSEAQSLLEIVKVTAGVEGALDIKQAEHNMRITEENYNIMKGVLTGIICDKSDEFPEARDFCAFLKEANAVKQNYQEKKVVLKSMNVGRMDYKFRQLCAQNKYHLPCDEL